MSLFVYFGACAGQSKRAIIFNGYFFDELPSSLKSHAMPADMQIFLISTPSGAKATGMYAPSIELTDEELRFALAVDRVDEGQELLRRFDEQKDKSKGFSLGKQSSQPLIREGDQFPAFSATDIDGRIWTNADVSGKVMVLNLWFTGCGPCRREMPELSSWKDEMPDVMFFSSTYEAPEIARQVLDKEHFNWIPLVNDTQFKDYIGNHGYPLTVIIDKTGRIAAFEYGTSPDQRESLKNKILQLR